MPERREGGCLCGRLRYAISGDPVAVVACHCLDCQRQSGSAFGLTMVVRREDFQWLRGEPKTFTTIADSGREKRCTICGDCGVRLVNDVEALPKTLNLKPGTLDDTSWFEPTAHVWVSRKQPWVSIPESVRRFEKNPG